MTGERRYPQRPEHAGWSSTLRFFREAAPADVRSALHAFVPDASRQQIHAWDDSIPPLQREARELAERVLAADEEYSAILEYQLPMEQRRPDVVLLLGGSVLVLELKGKAVAERVDVDQAAAYARDLRGYHRDCADRAVDAVLVLIRGQGRIDVDAGVEIIGPDAIDAVAAEKAAEHPGPRVSTERFLDPAAYRPLPSLVEAARELLEGGEIRRIGVVDERTRPTLDRVSDIAREAAATKSRHLILLTGLPGTGKTLIGLQLAHARFLSDLAVQRVDGKATVPAVFLSGNGPLIEVLQYELKGAGGGGKTFVRAVKDYVRTYSRRPDLVPPEHVLIFDEAQRAFDADQVARTHDGEGGGLSEPDAFIEFAERIPEWCVVVGLIGSGQEIHIGEESGLVQWRHAIERSRQASTWTVHAPDDVASLFEGSVRVRQEKVLHLHQELRFHLATDVHAFVHGLLRGDDVANLKPIGDHLDQQGYHFRTSRSLESAKNYLRDRYAPDADARFGMIASARDKDLVRFGIPNDYQSTKRMNNGPWFAEGDGDPRGRSCRELRECVTEFGCQGLELDATLLAWGTDLVWESGRWSNREARRYVQPQNIKDPLQLRQNAYRVLLTRGRDATVVFVPPLRILDATYGRLLDVGFRDLDRPVGD